MLYNFAKKIHNLFSVLKFHFSQSASFSCKIRLIIETFGLIFIVYIIGQMIPLIRSPSLMEDLKKLVYQFNILNLKQKIFQLLKIMICPILLSSILLIFCTYLIHRIYCADMQKKEISIVQQERVKYYNMLLVFLLVVYIYSWNMFSAFETRRQYTKFYNQFKDGTYLFSTDSSFKGYKYYYFMGHALETKNILVGMSETYNNQEEISLIEGLILLAKKQDKALSTFRSYLGNISLILKITHILYYSVGTLCFIFFMGILTLKWYFAKGQKSLYYNYSEIATSQHSLAANQGVISFSKIQKYGSCRVFVSVIPILLLALTCIITWICGDIFLEMHNGHRYSGYSIQNQLCSFHPTAGGGKINIQYEPQLQMALEFGQLKSIHPQDNITTASPTEKEYISLNIINQKIVFFNVYYYYLLNSELELEYSKGICSNYIKKLQSLLKLYTHLCEEISPYFMRSKEIQERAHLTFYRLSTAMILLIWAVSRLR